jgi:hypothetical protein
MKKCSYPTPGSGMKKCLDPDRGQNIPDLQYNSGLILVEFPHLPKIKNLEAIRKWKSTYYKWVK